MAAGREAGDARTSPSGLYLKGGRGVRQQLDGPDRKVVAREDSEKFTVCERKHGSLLRWRFKPM